MKPAHTLSIALLVLVAVGHVLRLLFQWELVINGMTVPMWPSVLAIVGFFGIAVALWRESTSKAG